jgi:hypothetical protein
MSDRRERITDQEGRVDSFESSSSTLSLLWRFVVEAVKSSEILAFFTRLFHYKITRI